MTAVNISSLQIIFFAASLFLISFLWGINISMLKMVLYIMPLLIFIMNHYIFVKGDYLEKITLQFEDNSMNKEKNRKIVMIILPLFIFASFCSIILLSYLKSRA